MEVRTGIPVDTGGGVLGDLTASTRLRSGVYQYRQVLPARGAVEGAPAKDLILEIEGDVTVLTQHVFAPTRVLGVASDAGIAPRLTVFAGRATRLFTRMAGEVEELSAAHGSDFWFSGVPPKTDAAPEPGGMLTFWTSHPGAIQAGEIDVSGGDGYEGGAGGAGGDVILDARCEPVSTSIVANGGRGGDSARMQEDLDGAEGGRGGDAGTVIVAAWSQRGTELSAVNVVAAGGNGGGGSVGGTRPVDTQSEGGRGGAGGDGGDGGRVRLRFEDGGVPLGRVRLALDGGNGGPGGTGGGGSAVTRASNQPGSGGAGGAGGRGGLPGESAEVTLAERPEGGSGGLGGAGGTGGNCPFRSVPTGDGGRGGSGGDAGSEGATAGRGGEGGFYGLVGFEFGTKGEPGGEGGVRFDLAETVPADRPHAVASLAYAQWNQEGSGEYFEPGNWLLCQVPAPDHVLFLRHDFGDAEKTLFFDGATRSPEVRSLQVESGWWHLNLAGRTFVLDPREAGLQLNDYLAVREGVLRTPSLSPGSSGQLKLVDAELQVTGDFALPDDGTLNLILDASMVNSSKALIHVAGTFRASGRLTFTAASGYAPSPGDRFRLVKFNAESDLTGFVYDAYRFKQYNSTIFGTPYYWGLAFRRVGAETFIELIVLKRPLEWMISGGTQAYATSRFGVSGLVLTTHGTMSGIGGKTDGAFGEMADAIAGEARRSDWDVLTVDWSEYATGALGADYNPATSAQMAIGIAESLDHHLRQTAWPTVPYRRFHLLGHSSGSWLVNRLMQLWTSRGSVQLTLFDAFTNPAEPCSDRWFWCNRFSDSLGACAPGATRTADGCSAFLMDDFVEHYVDRSAASPLGTDDRLSHAVNFDVTGGYDVNVAAAHAQPYKWYLESIRNAGPQLLSGGGFACGGFVMAGEFMDRLDNWPHLLAEVVGFKSTLRRGDELDAFGECRSRPLQLPLLDRPAVALIAQHPAGSVSVSPDGGVLGLHAAGVSGAAGTFRLMFPRPTLGLILRLRFGARTPSNSATSVRVLVDGEVRAVITPDSPSTERLRIGPILLPVAGVTEILEFKVELVSDAPASVTIEDITPLVPQTEAEPSTLLGFRVGSGGAVELARHGPLRQTVHVEASDDLVRWTEITNFVAPEALSWIRDVGVGAARVRFYRAWSPVSEGRSSSAYSAAP